MSLFSLCRVCLGIAPWMMLPFHFSSCSLFSFGARATRIWKRWMWRMRLTASAADGVLVGPGSPHASELFCPVVTFSSSRGTFDRGSQWAVSSLLQSCTRTAFFLHFGRRGRCASIRPVRFSPFPLTSVRLSRALSIPWAFGCSEWVRCRLLMTRFVGLASFRFLFVPLAAKAKVEVV